MRVDSDTNSKAGLDRLVGTLTRNPPLGAVVTLGLGLMPVLNVLSGALLALVLLWRGYLRTLLVLAAAVAGLALIGWATGQGAGRMLMDPFVGPLFGIWLPTLLLAWVLKASRSLALTFAVAALVGCAVVVGQLVLIADPFAMWLTILAQFLEPFKALRGLSAAQWHQDLEAMAHLMPGMSAAGGLVGAGAMLLLARYFQARQVRPGAFGEEFRRLRLGHVVTVIASLVLVLRLVLDGPVLDNLAIVMLALFLFQGLAVIHSLRLTRGWSIWVLVVFYILLVLLPLWLLGLVSGAGLVDNWFDFRRLRSQPPKH
ncbi:MAG: hypothetical protein WCB49_12535 [Gammaproteobacteria bacterium]